MQFLPVEEWEERLVKELRLLPAVQQKTYRDSIHAVAQNQARSAQPRLVVVPQTRLTA